MNTLRVTIENPDDVLGGMGALARVHLERSTTGGGVGFSEVASGPNGSPQTVVSGQTLYTFYDTAGAVGDYYRSRITDSANGNPQAYGAEFRGGVRSGLCLVEDIEQRLGTKTSDRENLIEYIGQVTTEIVAFTGHEFLGSVSSEIRTFDGFPPPLGRVVAGGRCLQVPRGIQSVSLLELTDQTGNTFSTMLAADYFLRPAVWEREVPGSPAFELWMTDIPSSSSTAYVTMYPGFATIRITGLFGWAAVPSDIERIAQNLTVAYWRSRGSQGGDTFTLGSDGERTFQKFLSSSDWRRLNWYRGLRAAA